MPAYLKCDACGVVTVFPTHTCVGGQYGFASGTPTQHEVDVEEWKRRGRKGPPPPAATRRVLVHDDDCGTELVDGFCPRCRFSPDMQSTAFVDVPS